MLISAEAEIFLYYYLLSLICFFASSLLNFNFMHTLAADEVSFCAEELHPFAGQRLAVHSVAIDPEEFFAVGKIAR